MRQRLDELEELLVEEEEENRLKLQAQETMTDVPTTPEHQS